MVSCNGLDIFQEKINELFAGLEYVRAYVDDQLIISNGKFDDHLNKIKMVVKKLLVSKLIKKMKITLTKLNQLWNDLLKTSL